MSWDQFYWRLALRKGAMQQAAFAVAQVLVDYSGGTLNNSQPNEVWPSLPTLAEEAKCSRQVASEAITELIDLGLVVRRSGGGAGNSNHYFLVLPAWMAAERPEGEEAKTQWVRWSVETKAYATAAKAARKAAADAKAAAKAAAAVTKGAPAPAAAAVETPAPRSNRLESDNEPAGFQPVNRLESSRDHLSDQLMDRPRSSGRGKQQATPGGKPTEASVRTLLEELRPALPESAHAELSASIWRIDKSARLVWCMAVIAANSPADRRALLELMADTAKVDSALGSWGGADEPASVLWRPVNQMYARLGGDSLSPTPKQEALVHCPGLIQNALASLTESLSMPRSYAEAVA